jgi:hypothetical protein
MSLGEQIKLGLFQVFIKNTCPDSNLRHAVQNLNSLPSRYTSWRLSITKSFLFDIDY